MGFYIPRYGNEFRFGHNFIQFALAVTFD